MTVLLVATHKDGTNIYFCGESKKEALDKFLKVYDRKKFKVKFYDEYENEI